MAHPKSYTPEQAFQTWKLRKVDNFALVDIIEEVGLKTEATTYNAMNDFETQLLQADTLQAYMNVHTATEEDIADDLDVPVEMVESHLESNPCLNPLKLFHLIFPHESEWRSIDDLFAEADANKWSLILRNNSPTKKA